MKEFARTEVVNNRFVKTHYRQDKDGVHNIGSYSYPVGAQNRKGNTGMNPLNSPVQTCSICGKQGANAGIVNDVCLEHSTKH